MAGTAKNYNPDYMVKGPGDFWIDVAIPAATARMTLHTDGTPDATENADAVHLGHTTDGAKFTSKPTFENYFADEIADPVQTSITGTETTLSANAMQVADVDLLTYMTSGIGTKVLATGIESVTLGTAPLVYPSVALIFRTLADSSKFGVIQLYKATNEGGIDMTVARKGMSSTPVSFKAQAVTTRAATDTVGNIWFQVAT